MEFSCSVGVVIIIISAIILISVTFPHYFTSEDSYVFYSKVLIQDFANGRNLQSACLEGWDFMI